jgi:hypothetical protein
MITKEEEIITNLIDRVSEFNWTLYYSCTSSYYKTTLQNRAGIEVYRGGDIYLSGGTFIGNAPTLYKAIESYLRALKDVQRNTAIDELHRLLIE